MYHHIDPNFGPDPAGDRAMIAKEDPLNPLTWTWTSADLLMLEFIKACHQRNIHIIFDGVFNHLGVRSFAFQDLLINQEKSIYTDWFTVYSWASDTSTFAYQGWFGVADLPELKEDERGLVAGPKKYVYDCTARWMMPNGHVANGIDGWRLDVAYCIDHEFWKDWRLLVKSINPNAYLTAEVVDKIEVVSPYLEGDEFDAVMNYGFGVIASEFFINQQKRITVSKFDSLLRELREAFPGDISYVQQNLFDSHDTQRFTSYIVNHDVAYFRQWGDYFGKTKADNRQYDVRKPTEAEYRIQQLMALFQFTYVGAPMVYYGDEVGMWGANDPDCRKPMVWEELEYADEVVNADGSKRAVPDKVVPNDTMLQYYQQLTAMRNTYPALRTGSFETILIDDIKNIYVYSRYQKGQKEVVVLLNNSMQDAALSTILLKNGVYLDVLSDEMYHTENTATIALPYFSGMVLVKE
jgi:cyclomaltodextrinase